MKNITQFIIFGFLLISLASCSKNMGRHEKENQTVSLDVTLARGATYQLDLSKYGDEDDLATIQTQATEFTKSEITNAAGYGKYLYTYEAASTPKVSSTDTDMVVLKIYEPEDRHHCGDEQTLITIHFTLK